MSFVQDSVISMATDAGGEPVRAVVVDAGNSRIARIIIEKVSNTSPVKTAAVVIAGTAAVAAVGYGAFKLYKNRKAAKASAAAAS